MNINIIYPLEIIIKAKKKSFNTTQSKISLEKLYTHNMQKTETNDLESNKEIHNQKTNKKITNRPFFKDIIQINNEDKDYNKTYKKRIMILK